MEGAPCYVIPDQLCQHAGVGVACFSTNKLGVFALAGTSETGDQRHVTAGDIKVHEIKLTNLLFNPITRKLINESCGTFVAVHKYANGSEVLERRVLTKFSRQYRSIVRACLENLQNEVPKLENPQKEQYIELIKIFYNVEFIWHLCEILYIESVPGDAVLSRFMDWIQFNFFHCERRAAAFMDAGYGSSVIEEKAEFQPYYWDTVIALLLQGRIDPARSLLILHSESYTPPFKAADYLLRSMPIYNVYGGYSVAEFNVRWKCWQNLCLSKLQSGSFASNVSLELIVKILAGDKMAFERVKSTCETWYQYMAAILLYTEPTVKGFDLNFYAHHCVAQFGGVEHFRCVDLTLLALFEGDLERAISIINTTTENGWFAAHLTDLLYLSGSLQTVEKSQDSLAQNLHEGLLLDYGTLLMMHPSSWQVAMSYFDHCLTQGRRHLELLLLSMPIATESKALKVIQAAKDRGMHEVVSGICKVYGMHAYKQKRLGNALSWALRSKDSAFATHLANEFLELYCNRGEFRALDLLENLGPAMLISDRLTFLGKYCEFHHLYRAGMLQEAGLLLVSLFASKLPPKCFWMILLMDALPLLEANEIIFSSEDTGELLKWLEKVTQEKGAWLTPSGSSYRSNADFSDFEDRIGLLRLALGRNLGRALCSEASDLSEESHLEIKRESMMYYC